MELKEIHLKLIPEFNGNPKLLSNFISVCEELINTFYNQAQPENFQNRLLLLSIKNKIIGHAAEQLAGITIKKWADIKQALLNSYSDKRDEFTLLIEISCVKQGNRSYLDYYKHISHLLNLYTAYVDTHYNNPLTAETLKTNATNLSLRVFTLGLKDPIGSLIRSRNPKTLNDAYNLLTNEFNVEYSKPAPKITQNNVPNKQSNITSQQFPSSNSQPFQFQQNQKQNFPSQPINLNPNTQPYRMFTPRQQLKNAQYQPKPTPMSVNTKITNRQPNNYLPQSSSSNRNYIAEEVYNQEIQNNFETEENFEIENNFQEQTEIVQQNSFLDEPSLEISENC